MLQEFLMAKIPSKPYYDSLSLSLSLSLVRDSRGLTSLSLVRAAAAASYACGGG